MKEMIYKPKGERVLLDRGTYKDHEYFVISLGTHPCAYVKLNGENPKIAENVPCHGGVTFTDTKLNIGNKYVTGDIIGWDYAHYGDYYMGYYETQYIYDGEKYTTGELIAECKRVIDWLTERVIE